MNSHCQTMINIESDDSRWLQRSFQATSNYFDPSPSLSKWWNVSISPSPGNEIFLFLPLQVMKFFYFFLSLLKLSLVCLLTLLPLLRLENAMVGYEFHQTNRHTELIVRSQSELPNKLDIFGLPSTVYRYADCWWCCPPPPLPISNSIYTKQKYFLSISS